MADLKTIWDVLHSIDVSKHTEKKGNLTYLSWAWAWGVLMEHYPESTYSMGDVIFLDNGSAEVWVTVNIHDHKRTMWLPVIDYKNKAIINPDSMAINTARMRCLTKCLAMFGLGHYIYAGEDLPTDANTKPFTADQEKKFHSLKDEEKSLDFFLFTKSIQETAYEALFNSFPKDKRKHKAKCNELEKEGAASLVDVIDRVTEMVNNDDPAFNEEFVGLEEYKKYIASRLDKEILTKMKSMNKG